MPAKRLSTGGLIDRSQPLLFEWEGKPLHGFAGDSLASALLANDEVLLGRSFKYHRPRGVMSAGVEESGAIVTVGNGAHTDPNVKAPTQALFQGLSASGQNAWPNVRLDVGAINGVLGRFFSAGFYYKTFMGLPPLEWGKGTGLWMQYEKIIRKAAGMGKASRAPDPDQYEHLHAFCDVLIVGSGAAGRAAAAKLIAEGLDVWLVEQDFVLGGQDLSGDSARQASAKQELQSLESAGVKLMANTTAFGLYDGNVAGLVERVTDHVGAYDPAIPRQRFITLRSRYTVLATGAIERMHAFAGNDLPGVMMAGAANTYLQRYGVLPGENIVLATAHDGAYATAERLAQQGARVTVVDPRNTVNNAGVTQAQVAGVTCLFGQTVGKAFGQGRVKSCQLARLQGDHWHLGEKLECDSVLLSAGFSPVVNLLSHRGVKPVWNDRILAFVGPNEYEEQISMAGSADGFWRHQACVDSGERAAQAALDALAGVTKPQVKPSRDHLNIVGLFEVRTESPVGKAFVDFQHDVTTDDIRLASQEGYISVEHTKRYTTLGMATDGGKVGNVVGIAVMADAQRKSIPQIGTTTFRPPYTPVSIGALRGRHVGSHFRSLRRTPMHQWNLDNGAVMTPAGLWERPWYFPQTGEGLDEAYIREAATVRKTVGLCDVTSLGKIAVQGPDATEFINRVYSNAFAKLPIGKARYGIMLRDDGIVLDDGTTWRMAENDYFMTTTTAHAAKVMVWLEELLQTRWPALKVHLTSLTDQWAGCAVAGPLSREVLAKCMDDPNAVSDEALPFMGVVESTMIDGAPCRIARISFSGERAFEVYVPADYGPAMMDVLWPAAKALDGCLYGLEALGTLRIEKGHVTGAELDGRVSIEDAGLGGMASPNKAYIGSVLKQRPEFLKENRPRLVGIFPVDPADTFSSGAILCDKGQLDGHGEGWVTAVTHSPAIGHWIGLGFISGGAADWEDKTAIAADPVRDKFIEVKLVSPHMVDPKGERMYG